MLRCSVKFEWASTACLEITLVAIRLYSEMFWYCAKFQWRLAKCFVIPLVPIKFDSLRVAFCEPIISCVVSLCEFSVSLFVLLCNNTGHNFTWVPCDVIFCGILANLDELLCNHICCNYVFFFSVLMFWFNVNFENTFGVCSVITFITTIFDSIMLRILVRFQQLFLSYFIPKCFDSLCTLSACLSLNLKWHESHLSNSFIIWLFVDSDTSIRCWFVVTIIATKYQSFMLDLNMFRDIALMVRFVFAQVTVIP